MECREARHLLAEVLSGTTPPDLRRALGAHIETCAVCRGEAHVLEETTALLRSSPEPRIPAGYWESFMAALDRRLEAERHHPWRRLVHWIRQPVHAWSAALATSAAAIALGMTLLGQPTPSAVTPTPEPLQVQQWMTPGMVDAIPAVNSSLTVWKASFGAPEVPYDLGGE